MQLAEQINFLCNSEALVCFCFFELHTHISHMLKKKCGDIRKIKMYCKEDIWPAAVYKCQADALCCSVRVLGNVWRQ